jgi:uncharacterized cofD-like protein
LSATERLRIWWSRTRLWLSVGIGVKRWLVMLAVACGLFGMGLVYLLILLRRANIVPAWLYGFVSLQFLPDWWRVAVALGAGGTVAALTLWGLGTSLVAPFRRPDEYVVQSLYRHRQGLRGPRVVAIGGGTGMPSLLRGLKVYTHNITAIVTVADDGGSSGRLRDELGLLPPGDFRNNIAALARDEALLTQVMQYRFGRNLTSDQPGQLQGHAFGNLLIAAMAGVTGSFDEALLAMDRVLAMRGRVVPSTLDAVTLVAEVEVDGRTERVVGESNIPEAGGRIRRVFLEPNARVYPAALKAIFQADIIVMGPGSLFTSVMPNLLVTDLAAALASTKAPKVYVCNIAMQPGETDGFNAADHASAILQHVPAGCLDIMLANSKLSVPLNPETRLVQPVKHPSVQTRLVDLVDDERPWRHDSDKLAKAVLKLVGVVPDQL